MAKKPAVATDPMLEAAEEASRLLKAMASPVRLRILCLLAEGEMPVGLMVWGAALRDDAVLDASLAIEAALAPQRGGETS